MLFKWLSWQLSNEDYRRSPASPPQMIRYFVSSIVNDLAESTFARIVKASPFGLASRYVEGGNQ